MILAISGLHGTGKTTVGKLIAEKLGIEYYSTGQAFRDLAREMNLSLEEFTKYVESNPDIDKKLDNKIIEIDSINTRSLPIIRIPIIGVYIYKRIYRILKSQNFNPDVVIAHMHDSFLWAHRVAKSYYVPFIVGIHKYDILFFQKKKKRFYINPFWKQIKAIKRSDLIAFRSESLRRHFIELFPGFNKKYFI